MNPVLTPFVFFLDLYRAIRFLLLFLLGVWIRVRVKILVVAASSSLKINWKICEFPSNVPM